jgi:hypothetical protein
MLRKILCVVIGLILLLMLWATLTVPTYAATAPALLSVALAVLLYFVWPRKHHTT